MSEMPRSRATPARWRSKVATIAPDSSAASRTQQSGIFTRDSARNKASREVDRSVIGRLITPKRAIAAMARSKVPARAGSLGPVLPEIGQVLDSVDAGQGTAGAGNRLQSVGNVDRLPTGDRSMSLCHEAQ